MDPNTGQPNAVLDKFNIDGTEYTKEDILKWKNGHMMQSDYTRKTQELANERKQLEAEREQLFAQQPSQQPTTPKTNSVESERIMKLELEVALTRLEAKYPKLDKLLVLKEAKALLDRGMPPHLINYEDIWMRVMPRKTEAEIEEELRQKILTEQTQQTDTTSIINNGGAPNSVVGTNGLTQEEIIMAGKLGMTPEEYKKYK